MLPSDDDMVVAYGMFQQIGLEVDVEGDLGAAEMLAIRCLHGLGFGDKKTIQFGTSPFEDGIVGHG